MKAITVKTALFCVCLGSCFLFSGCFNKSQPAENGFVTGVLSQYSNGTIIAEGIKGNDNQVAGPISESGQFLLSLKSGAYSLYARASLSDKPVLIKTGVQIENNVTVTVVSSELVPIPTVCAVSVKQIFSDSAVIEWQTNIESDGYIEYGLNELYGYATYASAENSTRHRIQIYSLAPSSVYHFRVVASRHNLEATKTFSKDYSFATLP